jgi:hypothetical protein
MAFLCIPQQLGNFSLQKRPLIEKLLLIVDQFVRSKKLFYNYVNFKHKCLKAIWTSKQKGVQIIINFDL